MSTPFKWTKQVAGYLGGVRNGLVISWPSRIKDAGGIRTQFHHVIDIVPTILEATGVTPPADRRRHRPEPDRRRVHGLLLRQGRDAPSTHRTQYFEMFGERGIYHDGWWAATVPFRAPWDGTAAPPKDVVNDAKWELFDLTKDWTQNNDCRRAAPRQAEGAAGSLLGARRPSTRCCRSMPRP